MNQENIFDTINDLGTDFRAEIIAIEIIENNIPAERVLVIPLGASNRPNRKDVETISIDTFEYDNKEYVLLKTHKEGLYDKLPEGLFHSPISYTQGKSKKDVIAAIKKHRQEEKLARAFFLPLDVAMNSVRVQVALYENQLDKNFHYNKLVNIFSPHFEIFSFLNVFQANLFLQFLPVIHRMRDDWRCIESFLELMFLVPFKLKLRTLNNYPEDKGTEQTGYSGLGGSAVGVNFTTGNVIQSGEFSEIVIKMGPLAGSRANEFIGDLQQEKVLYMLCDYMLPVDLDIAIEYELTVNDQKFILSEEENNSVMGVNAYL